MKRPILSVLAASILLLVACTTTTTTTITKVLTTNITNTDTTTMTTTTTSTVTHTVGNKQFDIAPDFQLHDLEGNNVSLSDFRGSPVLVTFWRSTWPHCVKEVPYLQEIYQEKAPPLVFLTVNNRDSLSEAAAFIENNNYTFPVLFDADYSVSLEYGIPGVPTTFFIDKDGIILARKVGAWESTAGIEAYLRFIMS